MSRRRRQGAPLMLTLVRQPWWVSAGLAVLVWAALTWHQATWTVPDYESQRTAYGLVVTAWQRACPFLTWALPGVLVGLSLISACRSWWRSRQVAQLGLDPAQTLQAMSWQAFEEVVADIFRRRGYDAEVVGGGGADGGVDVRLRRDGQLVLAQCKHHPNSSISVKVVRELLGVMVHQRAGAGIVVTSGRFTKEARAFAKGQPLDLIDGDQLAALARELAYDTPLPAPRKPTIVCPLCQGPMQRRVAKGTKMAFWGCAGYPGCRGTRPVDPT